MSTDATLNPDDIERAARQYAAFRTECLQCRREVQPDWQVCAHCSARLRTSCPECGVPLPPLGSSHCGHCGFLLSGPAQDVVR